jgi:hypothetical protein
MIQTLSFQLAPIFATLASFYGYSIIQKGSMTPDVAFVSILLFGMLRLAIYLLPVSLASAIKVLPKFEIYHLKNKHCVIF